MKINLFFLFIVGLNFSCAQQEVKPVPSAPATVRLMQCPPENLRSTGITSEKPRTAEDLVRYTVTSPAPSATNEWNINTLAPTNAALYLSCYYATKRILIYKLPLEKEFCMAKNSDAKLHVECLKK